MISEETYNDLKRFASETRRNVSVVTDWAVKEWLEVSGKEEIKLNAERSYAKDRAERAKFVHPGVHSAASH